MNILCVLLFKCFWLGAVAVSSYRRYKESSKQVVTQRGRQVQSCIAYVDGIKAQRRSHTEGMKWPEEWKRIIQFCLQPQKSCSALNYRFMCYPKLGFKTVTLLASLSRWISTHCGPVSAWSLYFTMEHVPDWEFIQNSGRQTWKDDSLGWSGRRWGILLKWVLNRMWGCCLDSGDSG